jgi:uncharacterized membrane protein
MMTDEDYRVRKARGTSIRAFFPILGLILMIAFGAVAYVLAPSLTTILENSGLIGGLSPELYERMDLISGVIIFMVMMLFTGLIYAIVAPKPKRAVTERDLDRERKARIAAEQAAKVQKKKIQAKMAEERRKAEKR